MANLTETSQWETGVTAIATTDPVLGGDTGPLNAPSKKLANRTTFLKDMLGGDTAHKTVTIAPDSSATQESLVATTAATNKGAIKATGNGSGAGVAATGGATGAGVIGAGGATSGSGGEFTGTAGNAVGAKGAGQGSGAGVTGTGGATGVGVVGTGGATSGSGGEFTGTAGNAAGVKGTGQGSASGGVFQGGATNGAGLTATGGGSTGIGVSVSSSDTAVRASGRLGGWFTGSGTGSAILADGTGSAGAIKGVSTGAATGIYGENQGSGIGIFGYCSGAGLLAAIGALVGQSDGASSAAVLDSSRGTGFALQLAPDLTSPVRAAVRWPSQDSVPTGAHQVGDSFMDSLGRLRVCTVVGTPGTWSVLKGTNTNDSAIAGDVGEYVVGQVVASAAISMGGTGVVTQVASIVLSAGDWDISAAGALTLNSATLSGTQARLCINTSVALPSTDTQPWQYQIIASPTASLDVPAVFPPFRASLSGSTTYYLLADIGYSAGTPKAYGQIRARRVR